MKDIPLTGRHGIAAEPLGAAGGRAGRLLAGLALVLAMLAAAPSQAETLAVAERPIADRKIVFATVESVDVTRARARIGGTVEGLAIDEGDAVEAGLGIATVVDPKIELELAAVDARIRSLEAQRLQALTELERARELRARGTIPQARLDDARTALDVVEAQQAAMRAERELAAERAVEGRVLAPATGRVLHVHVVDGSVVLPGEEIATIAAERYVLRLLLPERHARFIEVGDAVEVGARGLGVGLYDEEAPVRAGTIVKVFPELRNGQVVAEAEVEGLGDYFVGERVRVHVATGTRPAILVPPDYLYQRFGLHYARLADGREVVVQPGQRLPEGVEILSGLRDGDELVRP
jgi:membrane fusion protein, multidrug efflux system